MDEVCYRRQARAIQVDPELLAPLGRLQVAADRLRVAVLDAAAILHGTPLAAQPDDTLAAAVPPARRPLLGGPGSTRTRWGSSSSGASRPPSRFSTTPS